MYRLIMKMQRTKTALKTFRRHHTSHITARVYAAKLQWRQAQYNLDQSPESSDLKQHERDAAMQYSRLALDEEAFYKQKSRIQWLQLGDKKTAFFHKSVLHRQSRNMINSLIDEERTLIIDQNTIGGKAAEYFENLLTAHLPSVNLDQNLDNIYPNRISEESARLVDRKITRDDIKEALFSIPDSKAPGPDGFTAWFFKHAWSTIGRDFTDAILHFFDTGKLPKCVNATRIALVPKKRSS